MLAKLYYLCAVDVQYAKKFSYYKVNMLKNIYYINKVEAGCDEAGRGCLAGSVYAAAVILPPDYKNELLNDSKQVSEKKRYLLRSMIEKDALAWAVGVVTAEEIDKINILNASILAMHRALDALKGPTRSHYYRWQSF